jgi:hypothetical protein
VEAMDCTTAIPSERFSVDFDARCFLLKKDPPAEKMLLSTVEAAAGFSDMTSAWLIAEILVRSDC